MAYRIGISPAEFRQLFLSMTLNVLAGNVDDHNKNFSFMMGKDGIWHITPAYDFTFTVDPSAPAYINRHSMTVNGKNSSIGRRDLMEVARKYDVKGANALIEKAIGCVCNYRQYAEKAKVNEAWINKIQEEISNRIEEFGR